MQFRVELTRATSRADGQAVALKERGFAVDVARPWQHPARTCAESIARWNGLRVLDGPQGRDGHEEQFSAVIGWVDEGGICLVAIEIGFRIPAREIQRWQRQEAEQAARQEQKQREEQEAAEADARAARNAARNAARAQPE